MEFMKKYIHIAKCIKPALSSEASRVIADEYTKLRVTDAQEEGKARTQPITARTLETLIRLSTAHARARMSKIVTKEDALAAIELIEYAVFEEVTKKEKKRRRVDGSDGEGGRDSGTEDMDDNDDNNGSGSPRSKRSRRRSGNSGDQYDIENENDTEEANVTLRELRRAANRDRGQPADSEEMDTEDSEPRTLSGDRYVKHYQFWMLYHYYIYFYSDNSFGFSVLNQVWRIQNPTIYIVF